MFIRAVVIVGLLLLAGCGDDDDSVGSGPSGGRDDAGVIDDNVDAEDPADGDDDDADGDDVAECALLTDDEVEEAIGPHDGGGQDFMLGGCIWRATESSDDFVPAIHVAIVPADVYDSLAEIGDPVDGFGDGATYAELHGELWFPCRDDQFCGLKAHIAESDEREQTALALGRLVEDRA